MFEGAKLLALKEQLQNKMKVKREESRQKRQEIYALENEEGFEGGTDTEEERILDNADEMSEKSDTDIEDDQFDAEFGEEEFEEEDEVEEREVRYSNRTLFNWSLVQPAVHHYVLDSGSLKILK